MSRVHRSHHRREDSRSQYFQKTWFPANWQAHYETTAAEIWEQTSGRITHFIAGLGTSGTFVGATRRLKELKPGIKAISFQPDSPFHGLEGLKHMESAIVPGIYDSSIADENYEIGTEAAHEYTRRLGKQIGRAHV